jgi:hypothetical protein
MLTLEQGWHVVELFSVLMVIAIFIIAIANSRNGGKE